MVFLHSIVGCPDFVNACSVLRNLDQIGTVRGVVAILPTYAFVASHIKVTANQNIGGFGEKILHTPAVLLFSFVLSLWLTLDCLRCENTLIILYLKE